MVCFVIHRDGSLGHEKDAPFERILVTAAAHEVPDELFLQLKEGWILVIPVSGAFMQKVLKSCTYCFFFRDV